MLTAKDHRSAGTTSRVGALVLLPIGIAGIAVFAIDAYVESLGIPDDILWIVMFPILSLILGPLLIIWSGRHYRRAASMARIEAQGIAVWARFEKHKRANWNHDNWKQGAHWGSSVGSSVYFLHFTVYPKDGQPYRTIAEDHLPDSFLNTLKSTSQVPLLLDPEDPSLAAVKWDALTPVAK